MNPIHRLRARAEGRGRIVKLKHTYRVVENEGGWWSGEIRRWWWPFWDKLGICEISADDAIHHVKRVAEHLAKPRHVPTIINLGKLP